ncbi:MAG: 4Fe-4S binding protein [Clostridiales bacterium]|nr:4Fe-4S binding protein [Clostridiales bacterium]
MQRKMMKEAFPKDEEEEMFKVPREQIPWYPTIDEDKCIGCKECFDFCKSGVFEWDEEKNCPRVAQPLNCVVGCSACQNLCAQEAISFPSMKEIQEVIKKYHEGHS